MATVSVLGIATAAMAEQRVIGTSRANSSPPSWEIPVPDAPKPAPKGAPNVLIIMTDDVGYGAASTFGGPIPTPTFDYLAKRGLRYNQFNTTAICSPTRAALLTGRDPHEVNMGNATNFPNGYDGYTSVIPKSAGTLPRILRDNGYNTAMIGKGHITPEWEESPIGPHDRWPTGLGFEYFYGFLGGETNQWEPPLIENTTPVFPSKGNPGYLLDKDLADKAIAWLRLQRSTRPDQPFMMYYSTGTAHGPQHAPKDWIAKFKGQYGQGWDKMREETFARQKAAGVIPQNARLTPRPASLPAWSSLSADQRRLYARYMEVYAAALSYADHQIGRVIQNLRETGELENTIIIYIQGDNGGSGEGGLTGYVNENAMQNGFAPGFAYDLSKIDELGGPTTFNLYPAAWGWAMNTPFQWTKQISSHFGGIRNGTVISWPKGIKMTGQVRSQFHFVGDVMPTILDVAQIKAPDSIDGVAQKPITGVSMRYSFDNPQAPSERRVALFEMMQNIGIYQDGWFAGTTPFRVPWQLFGNTGAPKLADRKWELYNIDNDYSQATDLAKSNPKKLAELKTTFLVEAAKSNALPIHDHNSEGGLESAPTGNVNPREITYYPPLSGIFERSAPRVINTSFSFDADVDLPSDSVDGVIATQGGRFGGYSFYLKDGTLKFVYNATEPRFYEVVSNSKVPSGKHKLSMIFRSDSGERGAGGTVTLLLDGAQIGSGRIDQTLKNWISLYETFDLGVDSGTAPTSDYAAANSDFGGKIEKVTFRILD
ncbi:MAG: arylsulfatase [Sphingomonadaceae bacterium]